MVTTLTTLTTRIPRTWVIPTTDTAAPDPVAQRAVLRVLTVLLFCEIFLQRIGVPVGATQVPLILPLVLVGTVYLLLRGDLAINIGRTQAYLVAMAACVGAGASAFLRQSANISFTSVLLLVVIYLPFCYGLRRENRRTLFPLLLDRFVVFTTIMAGLAVFQFLIQLAGVPYTDVVKDVIPPDFVMKNFNTSYPVQYGSTLYKSNAFIGLEASFTSQFLALGLVVSVLRSARWWRIALFVLALLSTVSGTGVLLLGAASVLLAVHKGARFALTAAAVVCLVVLGLSFTPAAEIFAQRATESGDSGSSGNLRFVTPYQRMYDILADDPASAIVGKGPGWSDRDAADYLARNMQPLNYALVPKLFLEYGLVGGLSFLAFLATAFIRGSPSFVLSGSILVFYVILSSSLLSPVVGYLGLLLLSWYTTDRHALARSAQA